MANFPWLKGNKEDNSSDEGQKEFEALQAKLNKVDDIEKKVAKIDSIEQKMGALDKITEYINKQEEAAEAQRKAIEDKKNKENQPSNEDLAALMLTDPQAAVNKLTEGQSTAILQIRADNLKRQTFEDQEAYPYYTGDIKKKVDAILSSQPLQLQNNPSVIRNAYLTIVGENIKEINEGKIKARYATSSSSISGAPADDSQSREKVEITITDEIKKAARLSGMKPEEYVELLRKEEGIEIV